MLNNIVKLLFGSGLGIFSTVFNLKVSQIYLSYETLYLREISALIGIISAGFTCVYLYWQIKKIRYELKQKKLKNDEN